MAGTIRKASGTAMMGPRAVSHCRRLRKMKEIGWNPVKLMAYPGASIESMWWRPVEPSWFAELRSQYAEKYKAA